MSHLEVKAAARLSVEFTAVVSAGKLDGPLANFRSEVGDFLTESLRFELIDVSPE